MTRRVHTPAARSLRRRLDADLQARARRQHTTFQWELEELITLDLLADTVDRREQIQAAWDAADPGDRKSIVAFSVEMRQIDSAIRTMVKSLDPECEKQQNRSIAGPSVISQQARKAALASWESRRNRDGASN